MLLTLNDLPMGVAVINADGQVLSLNDVAQDVLGPAVEAALGKRPDSLVGVDVIALHAKATRDQVRRRLDLRASAFDPDCAGQPFLMNVHGEQRRTLLARVTPLKNDNGSCCSSMVFYDVTGIAVMPQAAQDDASAASRDRLIKIPVHLGEQIGLIDVDEAVRLEGRGHYTRVLTADNDFLSGIALGTLERRLDPAVFMRVHRSHVVNLSFINGVHRDGETLMLEFKGHEKDPVPVSRSHAAAVRKVLGLG